MALKTLMLRHAIDLKKQELENLRKKDDEFSKREAELEVAISEAENEEQQTAISEEVDKFEADKKDHGEAKTTLETEITRMEGELEELEAAEPRAPVKKDPEQRGKAKKEEITMFNIRTLPMGQRAFDALTVEQRNAVLAQEDVKQFLTEIRSLGGSHRSISGSEIIIPTVALGIIADNTYRYSKLMRHVKLRNVSGQARQTIVGEVPEAVWTEMCAAINELDFGFSQVTVDGYKVAGFIPVCNSLLEDNDANLFAVIVEMISESIAYAIDKAILYGKGASGKMPLGIVTRLAQQAKPSDYPANAPAWVDLHTTNIKTIGGALTGTAFWAALMDATGASISGNGRGEMFWAMNSKTHASLKSKAITFTAGGDVTANVFGILPVVSGTVEILEFMPDGDIVGGYGDMYLLAQRSGMQLDVSRDVQFIRDNTVFRGKQRMDGTPVKPSAFVAINIAGNTPTTSMDFVADSANETTLSALTLSGVTLSPAFNSGVKSYSATTTTASATVTATAENEGASVTVKCNGKAVKNGGTVTWKDGTNSLAVTVTNGNGVRVYTVNVTKTTSGG